jgi:hypothetical protein
MVCVVASIAWMWPKSDVLSYDEGRRYFGHFRGFGLAGNCGCLQWLVGRSYYSVTYPPTGRRQDGVTTISAKPGYNYFRGTYPDGTLREEGEGLTEYSYIEPIPNTYKVRWGKYYHTDGTLGSEIVNGSGTQTYWIPDGTKVWELVLLDQVPVRVSEWYQNGEVAIVEQYKNGLRHGAFTSFWPDGRKKVEGAYNMGSRDGKWIRYDCNGKIASVEHYKHGEGEERESKRGRS